MIFSNRFVDTFPGDNSYSTESRQTPGALYALVRPTPTQKPQLLAWSHDLAKKFNLDQPQEFSSTTNLLSGHLNAEEKQILKPYAACYGGHQFGHWADQLGDGRAITLGEIKAEGGPFKDQLWDLQLKGAGRSAYSRFADGRAVLRSSVREYIASEAMHFLGVPTTRALSLCLTGDDVLRDIMYDGHPKNEPGAIVARMAPSFIRFGNFEILAARGEQENLQKLTDFVIQNFYPEITSDDPNRVFKLFKEVSKRTAVMISHWMRVGFVHGVMNTDNMSIIGLTIDYGPYGFLDNYDPMWTPNTTDLPGRRYCFGRQPQIAQWNLARLAEALLVLVPEQIEKFQEAVEGFEGYFRELHFKVMQDKLGLDLEQSSKEDLSWLSDLETLFQRSETDMTYFYSQLTRTAEKSATTQALSIPAFDEIKSNFYKKDLNDQTITNWKTWLEAYEVRVQKTTQTKEQRHLRMKTANPVYIPRNFILQEIIESLENEDRTLNNKRLNEFLAVMKAPYEQLTGKESLLRLRPDWALNKVGCSTLSCSS